MIDILVAEDEPAILESLNFILGRCGWIVDLVRDGEEALDAVRRYKPRLLLLDIMLPKRSGLDVLKTMRADPRLNQHTGSDPHRAWPAARSSTGAGAASGQLRHQAVFERGSHPGGAAPSGSGMRQIGHGQAPVREGRGCAKSG